MFNLGMGELILIFVIALVVFGPDKLPEIGRNLGKGLREFKKSAQQIEREAFTVSEEAEHNKKEQE